MASRVMPHDTMPAATCRDSGVGTTFFGGFPMRSDANDRWSLPPFAGVLHFGLSVAKVNAMKSPIQRAVAIVGTQAALATTLKVSAGMVSQWMSGHRPVAANHCLAIERATGGKVTRYELAPDVFGPAPKRAA